MKKMLGALVGALHWFVQRLIHPLIVALIGEVSWSPPRWLRFLAYRARSNSERVRAALSAERDRHPRRFWSLVATVLVCFTGSVAGWNWYRHFPKPHKLSVTGTWPRPTRLERDARPDPLVLRFSGSAALLAQVGKEVKSGITVEPPLEGTWNWQNDASLVFTPKADWDVGRKYTIHFDRRLFPSHVLLSSYAYEFQTPAFASSIAEAQFYDDPTNPKIKKVVATVRFTHPVDKTDFEKRIGLRMRIEPVKSFDSPDAKTFGFKVMYDEFGGKAFIHSDPFPIPGDEAEMLLTIAKGIHSARGGPGTREKIERSVHVPGIESYFRITDVSAAEAENEHEEVDRVGTISASAQMRQSDLDKYLSVVLLPKNKPAVGDQAVRENYRWSDPLEVVPEVLKLATPVKVEWLAPEHEWSTLQSFKFAAEADRDLLVTIRQGLTSFGDYPLKKDFTTILHAEPLQRTVKIVSQGALLSLTGERKISIRTRSVDAVQLEVSRILPGNLSNLVSQSVGTFENPQFGESQRGFRYGNGPPRDFGLDNLSEIFTEVRTFPPDPSGRNHYTELNFSSLLSNGAPPRGLFSLAVEAWDPRKKEPLPGGPVDRRLVLLTDLGLLVKDSADGSHDAFVQSIRTGEPVTEATVSVLGKNGLAILSAKTDVNGHVAFPTLKDFKREKTPTVYTVEKDGDLSFLPVDRSDRRLNFSRFDTGGVYSTPNGDSLQAYLFSDRGIYRPGDEIHLGMIVRTIDWTPLPEGLPLELVVSDPRGIEIHKQLVKFPTVGFEEFSTTTQEDSPTGSYQFGLYIKRDKERKTLLGSTSVRVEEFQPDRMIIKAELSAPPSEGWIAPGALGAKVLLRNLFGTPATGRTIKASFRLWPSVTAFSKYAAYRFHDPYATKKSYEEHLGEVTTDADGRANFDMKLERFERGIYHLRFIAEGFEPEGGRSVVAEASALVSPAPFLVAYKPDGDLHYLKKDSERSVHVVAVDPKVQSIAAPDLEIDLVEIRYVSVLTRQENGTFAYQSVKKEISREKKPLTIPASGFTLKLPTAEPGSYAFAIRDSKGEELNRISFDVVGQANVSRSLEREAELKLKLGSSEVKPGDEVEVEIEAPYVGSGLITVERDRVYNAKWFTTTTTGSVQKIRVPEELEGNGYVTVTFLRSLDSKEIFTSPLSYGAAPFAVSRARHSEAVSLHVPELVRPGEKLRIGYQTNEAAKLLLVAVDEGILQVARYQTPDPLGHFFRKRALEVSTSQILDLLLPEIRLLNEASAPGGDEEGRLARHLNPFKRKGQRPIAFWSGIVDSDGKPGSVDVAIPDYFNGTVRVMAVAANDRAIGVAEAKTVSQGYFVIQPQAPYFAAPDDEFDVTSLVANNTDPSGTEPHVKVSLETSSNLEVVGKHEHELSIPKGGDQTLSFRVRARSEPGGAHLTIKVSGSGKQASYSFEMSIRPAAPFVTTVQSGYVQQGLIRGAKADLALERKMFGERRRIEASASSVPLGLATGLVRYLQEYPYGCTEQLVSQAFPGVILGARPEFGLDEDRVAKSFARALATLEGRQNAAGAFAVWGSGSNVSNFLSVYATHFLIEAREHGRDVPGPLVERASGFLNAFASSRATTLPELRAQAYALYLLARSGVVVTNQLASIREALDATAPKAWEADLAGLYLAATYELLKMDKPARALLAHAPVKQTIRAEYESYYDDLVYRAQYLYLVAKHFPDELPRVSGGQINALADSVVGGRSNTISSAYAILGLDAYSRAVEARPPAKLSLSEVLGDKTSKPLRFANSLFARAEVPADAKGVHFESDGPQTLFYQLSEAGFDLEPPTREIKDRLEVYRELKNEKGEPVTSINLDSKLYVHVLVRALEAPVDDVAVVDLLPGGFELDISPEALGSRVSLQGGADAWRPTYIDAREDRVIFFGRVDTQARRFVYRLKPTNRGRFAVAPVLAEGMYERSALARSLGGSVSVEK